jgi:Spy/CpxP family protein refolding chaperone
MRSLVTLLSVIVVMWAPSKVSAQGVRERVAERVQDLNLTDEQEARVAEIRKTFRPKVQQAIKELGDVVNEEVKKVRAVLTPEQQTKLAGLKEERQERRAESLGERLAHLHEMDLTGAEMDRIAEIRKEYHPRIVKAMEGLHGLLSAEQRTAREEALKAGKRRSEMLAALKLKGDQKTKVEAVCKEVCSLVHAEMEKIRDVLSESQKATLQDFAKERREHVRDRRAHRIANLKELNLTEAQVSQLTEIRKQYRPRVHEGGNRLRATVREEVEQIIRAIKG